MAMGKTKQEGDGKRTFQRERDCPKQLERKGEEGQWEQWEQQSAGSRGSFCTSLNLLVDNCGHKARAHMASELREETPAVPPIGCQQRGRETVQLSPSQWNQGQVLRRMKRRRKGKRRRVREEREEERRKQEEGWRRRLRE